MLRMIILTWAFSFCLFAHAGEELESLPLHVRLPGQRVLLVMGGEESAAARNILDQYGIKSEIIQNFDKDRDEYSGLFAIVVGSNHMDYFGKPGNKEPEAFQHIERFVREGGHLFVFGAFNGRSFGNMKRFGIRTGSVHSDRVEPVPGHTDALFHGLDELIPQELKLRSTGNFGVDVEYVNMLNRAVNPKVARTALPTISVDHGRVSTTLVEPYYRNSMWLLPVVMHWIVRGAPTTVEQLNERPVLDPLTFRQRRENNVVKLGVDQQQTLQADVQELLASSKWKHDEQPSRLVALAEKEVDAPRKFAMLLSAADLYAERGNADGAIASLLASAELFRVDVGSEQVRLLQLAALNASHRDDFNEIARLALDYSEDAADEYRIDQAWQLAQNANICAKQAGNAHYQQLSGAAIIRLAPLHEAWLNVADMFDKWRANPEDPAANFAVGKFLAFVAEGWEIGLTCLSAGSDEDLRDLALLSQAPQETTLSKVRLADRWMRYAETVPPLEREGIRHHARMWYQEALEDLSSLNGADQNRVRRALKDAAAVPAELKIRMKLDGYGLLKITSQQITWTTQAGEECSDVSLNVQNWNPVKQPILLNRGSTRFLPRAVNLNSAKLGPHKGRGLLKLQDKDTDSVVIRVSDVPAGEDDYEFTIRFSE